MLDQAYSRRQFLGLAGGLASIVGLGLVGCGGAGASDAADKGSAAAAESVSGEVTYDGASSFQALVEAAAEKFMDANPDVSVSGSGNGSGKGLTAVAAGTVTIGNSDVFAETKLEADQVKNLVDHEVAVVGMGPVVSKNVKVDDLSLEQLKGIFSGQITNWKEVGGDDATIVVLNRKAGSGTRATFEAAVFGDETVDFKGDAELDKSGDVQTQMSSTDNAISYLDFSHFDDSKFTAVKVGGVEPASENVLDNSFPIWATEHMYCAKDADDAMRIAEACIEGGCAGIELTYTTPGVNAIIEKMAREYDGTDFVIGAGTVMDPETARMAILSGAQYVVSPYFNGDTVRLCNRYRVACMPGAMSIAEVVAGMEAGADIIKVFPGELFGPKILKSIHGPIPQAELMPTGGVSLDNVAEWIAAGAVAVGAGGSLTAGAKTGDYGKITETARQFVEKIRAARGQ